jgi:hypothetical protein
VAKNPNNLPLQPNPQMVKAITPEVVGQLVENQAKELELRAQELALQKQQDDHGFEFSKKALETQLEDRKLQREHNIHLQRNQYILSGILSVMVVVIIITALFLNKETIAIEMIKAIVFLLAGGIGGYGLSKKKGKQPTPESDTSTSE